MFNWILNLISPKRAALQRHFERFDTDVEYHEIIHNLSNHICPHCAKWNSEKPHLNDKNECPQCKTKWARPEHRSAIITSDVILVTSDVTEVTSDTTVVIELPDEIEPGSIWKVI